MNAVAPAPAYSVVAADAARDREDVLAVWRGNLGQDARMAAKFDWFYADSPLGPPLSLLLRDADGAPVGVATAGARRLRAGGAELRAGVLVDLAVLPGHRTLGPALMLQEALIEAARGRFDLLYGLPNRKAVPVFKRVGYAPLGEMHRLARVLRHRRYLAQRLPHWLAALVAPVVDLATAARDGWRLRRAPRLLARWSGEPPVELPRAADDGALRGVHDAAFQRWRFAQGPTPPAAWLLLARADDGAPAGWFAVHGTGEVLHVVDAGGGEGDTGPSRAAIHALLREARRRGHVSVSVQLAAPEPIARCWRDAGFVVRGARTLYGRWLGAGAAPSALLMTAADEDE